MDKILITNNPLVQEKFLNKIDMIFSDTYSYLDVLIMARDKIHKGHILLTHPLSGSIKPNETPYKSLIITKTCKMLDENSLSIIESSILTYNKFIQNKKMPMWTDKIRKDFQLIDYDLIHECVE